MATIRLRAQLRNRAAEAVRTTEALTTAGHRRRHPLRCLTRTVVTETLYFRFRGHQALTDTRL